MKYLIILLFYAFCGATIAKAQLIKAVTMDEVVSYVSKKNDTTYIVNFWSTYCAPCLEELPFIQKIAKKYASQKVKLLLISLDTKSFYETKLSAFIKKNKITATTFWLKETNADEFCPKIDTNWSGVIPATLILNTKKGYRRFYETEFTPNEFETAVKNSLE